MAIHFDTSLFSTSAFPLLRNFRLFLRRFRSSFVSFAVTDHVRYALNIVMQWHGKNESISSAVHALAIAFFFSSSLFLLFLFLSFPSTCPPRLVNVHRLALPVSTESSINK
jgi:Cu/Ag efflux pump CusA